MRRIGAVIAGLALSVAPPRFAPAEDDPAAPAGDLGPTGYESLFPFGARGLGRGPTKSPREAARREAIEAGVRWLVAHQTGEGSWDPSRLRWCDGAERNQAVDGAGKPNFEVGVTGLALSAILGAGPLPASTPSPAAAVSRALRWLLSVQDADGCIGERHGTHFLYGHAFAALALVEAFGATGDAALLGPALKALRFGEASRNPEAGWRYGVRPADSDTSLTGCMAMPYVAAAYVNEAAEAAGREEPFPLDERVAPAVRAWVESMTEADTGRVGYVTRGQGPARVQEAVDTFPAEKSESTTAIGVVLRQRLPGGETGRDAEAIRLGTALLAGLPPAWTPGHGPDLGNVDLYYWYYGALAMDRLGGAAGEAWTRALVDALTKGQRKDGEPCDAKGSWDAVDAWSAEGGRLYCTAAAVLCLETPTRFPRLVAGRPDLVGALEGKDLPEVTQAQLLGAVAAYGAGGVEKGVLPFLNAQDANVRIAAALALARAKPSPAGVQALGALAADGDVGVRRAAVAGLADLGADAVSAIAPVTAALSDADDAVREGAATILGGSGAAAQGSVEALTGLLRDPAVSVRVAAATSVFRLSGDAAAAEPVLLAGLRSPDPRTRAGAARGVGLLGPSPAREEALRPLLDEPLSVVVAQAAAALWRLRVSEPRLVLLLKRCLEAGDAAARTVALETLGTVGPDAAPAVDALGKAALAGSRAHRVLALQALGSTGKPAAPATPALHLARASRHPAVRSAADAALARLALPPAEALPVLTKALESADERWVDGAIAGFHALGPAAATALVSLLESPGASGAVRTRVVRALGGLGPGSDAIVLPLTKVLDASKDSGLRLEAAKALGALGPKATPALDALLRRIDDADLRVPLAAVRAIGRIATGNPGAVAALAGVLDRKAKGREPVRVAAAEALGELKALAVPAIPSLVSTFGEEENVVPNAAVQALGRIGKPAVLPVRDRLKIVSPRVRGWSALALAAIGAESKAALTELMLVFDDPTSDVHSHVGQALLAIGSASVRPLTNSLKNRHPAVRRAAAEALGEFGRDAAGATAALKSLLADPDADVARAAQAALDRVKVK
jgi:HEAT repeat protein